MYRRIARRCAVIIGRNTAAHYDHKIEEKGRLTNIEWPSRVMHRVGKLQISAREWFFVNMNDSRAGECACGHLLCKLVAFRPKEHPCFRVILFCIAVTARFFWHAACILECWRRSAECRLLVLVASTSKAKENHHVVLGFGLFCRRAIGRRIW